MSNAYIDLVVDARGLNGNQKAVLFVLANRRNDVTARLDPSVATISGESGVPRSTVFQVLKWLETAGLLTRKGRARPDGTGRTSNAYTLVASALKKLNPNATDTPPEQATSGSRTVDVPITLTKDALTSGSRTLVVREPDGGSPGAGQEPSFKPEENPEGTRVTAPAPSIPSKHCPRHPNGTERPCRPCGTARRAHEQATADADADRAQRRLDADRAPVTQARANHTTREDAAAAARRGRALVNAALNGR